MAARNLLLAAVLLACLAQGATPVAAEAERRQLLQGRNGAGMGAGMGAGNGGDIGARAFADVAQHKMPTKPTLTRKDFSRRAPGAGRHLLQGRNGAGMGAGMGAGNGGDIGARAFADVAQHKMPTKPTLTRKDFSRRAPGAGRHLLQGRNGAGMGAGMGAGNGGDIGARAFADVAQHKTPTKPTLTRKDFSRRAPGAGRHLLQGRNGAGMGAGMGAGNGGDIGARAFADVAQHKMPTKPTLTRKDFSRRAPGAGRHLLQGVRAFANVAQHKTPNKPTLTRKDFSRRTPGAGRHLL